MKLAIIGTGKIVQEALYAMELLSSIEVRAIFGRPHSREKAQSLADQYRIPEVYTDYKELLERSDADTVYIGLINSVHYTYAKEALLHGKNVILEKPFVLESSQAEELRDLAKKRKRIILEAITVHHSAVFRKMQESLPRIGAPKLVLCNYSQYSRSYDAYLNGVIAPVFDPAQNGGALNDLGVYTIHYCVGLFGMPEQAAYFPNRGYNGVDTSGALVLMYPGFTCVCAAAKDSDSAGFISVQGEKGWMRADGKPNAAEKLTVQTLDQENRSVTTDASGATVRKSVVKEFLPPSMRHRMTQEFADFAEIIDGKEYAAADELMKETVQVVKVLEMAGRSGI
ncbi:MAG: Gfo/Idh/MocA family protein [Bilifractor sp.]|jgi:predicted dehydrogenase